VQNPAHSVQSQYRDVEERKIAVRPVSPVEKVQDSYQGIAFRHAVRAAESDNALRRPSETTILSVARKAIAEKLDSPTKTFSREDFRCCLRHRERAGLADPRSAQSTALKAPLFHGSRCFLSPQQERAFTPKGRIPSFSCLS
jgi:hypothetical protein